MVERNDAEGFLTTLASSPGIAAWQVEQATDALTLLLGSAYGQETDGGEPAERSPVITMRRAIRGGYDPLDDEGGAPPHPAPPRAAGAGRARGPIPCRWAPSDEATRSARAPSLTPEAFPAVTVPGTRNDGFSRASPSSGLSGLGGSCFP